MPQIYRVLYPDDSTHGVAYYTEKDSPFIRPPGIFVLPEEGLIENWSILDMELRDGDFTDYLTCTIAYRLCSERMKNILQEHASQRDEIQWLPTSVTKGNERRVYWILHFPNPPDVFNYEKTIFSGKNIVKPVLSSEKIREHQVFAGPQNGGLSLYITKPTKIALEAAQCTGMEFSRMPVHP